jgi:hypothetical protein
MTTQGFGLLMQVVGAIAVAVGAALAAQNNCRMLAATAVGGLVLYALGAWLSRPQPTPSR